MLVSTFLSGKVRKWSLPVVDNPAGAGRLKRLLLPQGELAQIYDADEGIRYIALVQLRAGAVRGNHYHSVKEEYVYLLQGEVLLRIQDIDSGERDSVPLRTGDLVFLRSHVAHALQATEPGHAIEFSTSRFDRDDTYKFPLT